MTKITTNWKKKNESSVKNDLKAYSDSDTKYSASDVFYNSFDGSQNLDGKNATAFSKVSKNTTGWSKTSKNATGWS